MDSTQLHENQFRISKEMIISYAQDGNFQNNIPNIKIDGLDVDKVDCVKLLGVTVSHDLK